MKKYTVEEVKTMQCEKLNMTALGDASKMWKKLKEEAGISMSGIKEASEKQTNFVGFDTATEEELDAFKETMTKEALKEFEEYPVEQQRQILSAMKEKKRKENMELEFIDTVIANYYIIENELTNIVSKSCKISVLELREQDIDVYLVLLARVIQDNINFFKSAAKLNIKLS